MITVDLKLNLYSFEDLSQEAKTKAVYEHLDFLNQVDETEDDEQHTEETAIDNIEVNEYLFFADGSLAHTLKTSSGHYFIDDNDVSHLI